MKVLLLLGVWGGDVFKLRRYGGRRKGILTCTSLLRTLKIKHRHHKVDRQLMWAQIISTLEGMWKYNPPIKIFFNARNAPNVPDSSSRRTSLIPRRHRTAHSCPNHIIICISR
jgi:hypothetical protein